MRKVRLEFVTFTLVLLVTFSLIACRSVSRSPAMGHDVSEESGVDYPSEYETQGSATGPGGYTSRVSYLPGEQVDFHISNNYGASYDLRIYREGDPRVLMGTVPNVQTQNRGCNQGYGDGCDWPVSASFVIPADWPSGVYMADFPRSTGGSGSIIFWIREKSPGGRSPILFLSSVNTYQAYNDYGGGSLYGFGDSVKAQWVSFNRPYSGGDGKYPRWEKHFVEWADRSGYEIEYATTYDLEYQPNLLDHYEVAIIAGHSEYWSWPMRREVETFIERGGRFMNLSGNTMWWQVRFENNGRTMIGYKNWKNDPIQSPQGTTDENWKYPIFDGSFSLIGLHWPFGGYPTEKGYAVVNADHWIYEGAGVVENEMIGVGPTDATSIQDKETDGLAFNCAADGRTILGPTGSNMAPRNFTILGITPVYSKQRKLDGFGMMGLYTNAAGGAVFSAGTTGWPIGLQYPEIDKITRNVLDRFVSGNFPQEPPGPDAGHLFLDRFNCDNVSDSRFNNSSWVDDMTRLNYYESAVGATANRFTAACGVTGTGLALKMGQAGIYYASELGQNFTPVNQLQTQVFLNVSELNLGTDATVDLFHQYVEAGQRTPEPIAVLQLGKRNGQIVVRYQPAGANLNWRPVPENQTFLLRTVWDATNRRVGLWINETGGYTDLTGQMPSPNRSDYGRLKVSGTVGGTLCMDDLSYNDLGGAPPPPPPPPPPTPTATPPGPTPTATPPAPTPTATPPAPTPTATPPSGPQMTVLPVGDAPIYSARVTRNYGPATTLRVRDGRSDYISFLQFDLEGLDCALVERAVLRLKVLDSGPDGGSVHLAPNNWTEASIKWSNAPAITGSALDTAGAVAVGQWVELDVTDAVSGNGLVSFALRNANSDIVKYSSREGSAPPQLVVFHQPVAPAVPVAAFEAQPRFVRTGEPVQFSDQSTGCPSSWLWDFGDGATSSERNPAHAYASPGVYTVELRAANGMGSDVIQQAAHITVEEVVASTTFLSSFARRADLPGASVEPEDLVAYDKPNDEWVLYFDGSLAGIGGQIRSAFVQEDGGILLTFSSSQVIDALGTVTASDIVRFVPTGLGPSTTGRFEWYFDGSDVELATNREKIDALTVLSDGDLLISTSGTAKVSTSGGTLAARDEDILRFTPAQLGAETAGQWSLFLDGSSINGLAGEDVVGLSVDEASGELYLAIQGGFIVDGIRGNGRDILRLRPASGSYQAMDLHWDGSEVGLPANLAALHMVNP